VPWASRSSRRAWTEPESSPEERRRPGDGDIRGLFDRQGGEREALEEPIGLATRLMVAFIAIQPDGLCGIVTARLRELLAREVRLAGY